MEQQRAARGWRKSWADTANEHMQKAGIDARIDHRSLKEQKAELDAILPPERLSNRRRLSA
jgi:hypothetical protein